jgi:hypothetical protein
VGLAAALVLGGVIDPLVLLPAVLLTQVLLAVAWFPALQATSPIGGRIVVLGGRGCRRRGRARRRRDPTDGARGPGAGDRPARRAGPPAGPTGRPRRAHHVVDRHRHGHVFACLGSAWLALDVSREGTGLLVLGAVAAAAPAVVDLAGTRLSRPSWAAGVWAACGDRGGRRRGRRDHRRLAPGGARGRCRGGRRGRLAVLFANRAPVPHPLLPAALPPVLVAPVVYLLGRLLVG